MGALPFVAALSFCPNGMSKMLPKSGQLPIIADIGPLPSDPDPTSIGSVSKYLFLSHIVRTPIVVDRNASIKGDLLESWTVSPDQKIFRLQFKKGEHFNDGTPITAQHFADTLSFRRSFKGQIHFDFSLIDKVVVQGRTVEIQLSKPLPLFITNLSQPEFGILHPATIKKPELGPKECSGFYCLSKFGKNAIDLVKNKYAKSRGPENVLLRSFGQEKYEKIEKGEIQFIMEFGEIPAHIKKPKSDSPYELVFPHIGFTHWLSINPLRPSLSKLGTRKVLQQLIKDEFSKFDLADSGYEPAEQLFLPGGPGRLSESEAKKTWTDGRSNLDKAKPNFEKVELVVLLTDKFPFQKQLRAAISSAVGSLKGQTKFVIYHDQKELQQLVSRGEFDILLINNDFSGFDLTLSVGVTFNPQRPLIVFEPNSKLSGFLDELSSEPVMENRAKLLLRISEEVLRTSLIVPLVYKRAAFIKSKQLDISDWSLLFPEVSFWKAEVK